MYGNRRTPVPATPSTNASLIEVFSSMQGEGVLIGARQVFVRFADCNLDCNYCDTPFKPGPTCQVEEVPGSGQFESLANPVELGQITALISKWQCVTNNVHHSVALTGGEPLLHADTLKSWLPEVMTCLPIFLETNGTLPSQLEKVLPFVDMISMDIKGASTTGVATPWREHAEFMAMAAERLCQVKLVIDQSTPLQEILQSARICCENTPETPFILQPRTTPTGPAIGGPDLLALQVAAAKEHPDVRIIPQIHPFLGVA